MHIGLKEREDAHDEDDDTETNDVVDEVDEELDLESIDTTEKGVDTLTTDALEVIQKKTQWLQESVDDQNHQMSNDRRPTQPNINWINELERQSNALLDNDNEDECVTDSIPIPNISVGTSTGANIGVSIQVVGCKSLNDIADDIINEYSLNAKQKMAFNLSIENVKRREQNLETQQTLAYVGGPGGTGKSQLIKAIVAFHQRINAKKTVKLTAYTGTAAAHIGGSTTHALFGTEKKSKKKLEKRFQHVNTLIIDEVSMIGCRHLYHISQQLSVAKPDADRTKPFAGLDVIFLGDFMQFKPVNDTPLYSAYRDDSQPRSSKRKNDEKVEMGRHLWSQVEKIVFLTEQMRVTDQAYLDFLNRLRAGECTDEDMLMLSERVIGNFPGDTPSFENNVIICPGNELVMQINDMFATQHSETKKVFVTTANDTHDKKRLPKKFAESIKNLSATNRSGIPRELRMFVGMPVCVSKNQYVELGITNGATGVIKEIHLRNGRHITEDTGFHHVKFKDTDCIILQMDDVKVQPLDGLERNFVPIYPDKGYFGVRVKGKTDKVNVATHHFPIVPRFSCTSHKAQGQTLSKAIVDLVRPEGNKSNALSFAYVPLSRVRRLEDLTILRDFDPKFVKGLRPLPGCIEMIEHFKTKDLAKNL